MCVEQHIHRPIRVDDQYSSVTSQYIAVLVLSQFSYQINWKPKVRYRHVVFMLNCWICHSPYDFRSSDVGNLSKRLDFRI